MANYTVTHACGHTKEHNITGTNVRNEREHKAAWLAELICSDCKDKAKQDKINTTNATLVQLSGSPKQIDWANAIRANAIQHIKKVKEQVDETYAKAEDREQQSRLECALQAIDDLINAPNSKTWIDAKDSFASLLKTYRYLEGKALEIYKNK
ncbi:hypothetical protein [Fastidiosibacter lacustris]|uniref:hypothetical protein n=1 Tax=Fastidiosibacter lacustris TaxID=2056695 RepID=UPI000E346451|nr:hypothetical protein [Fastidiosibacter lacustris]